MHVRLAQRGANLSLHLRKLQPPAGRNGGAAPVLPPRALDLLETAAAVYAADRWLPRARHGGRRIRLRVEARDPGGLDAVRPCWRRSWPFWAATISDVAARAGDEVADPVLEPPLPGPAPTSRPASSPAASTAWPEPSIWSRAAKARSDRCSWSANASSRLAHTQATLGDALAKLSDRIVAQRVFVSGGRSPSRGLPSPPGHHGEAQHLRSLLFLSLAAASALLSGSRALYVCENGPMALNPVVSEGRSYTRTAHPGCSSSSTSSWRPSSAVPGRSTTPSSTAPRERR